jgi:8-oxo-dGTP diphosphatase
MATPRVAAGALFFDEEKRVLLVKPTYKNGWDIPGGYVEPGESPRNACLREVEEELGIAVEVENHLVVDWAPAETEGDKLLFVFDGGLLTSEIRETIVLADGELSDWSFVPSNALESYLNPRLTRRIRTAIQAKENSAPTYAEHGEPLGSKRSSLRVTNEPNSL